MMDNNISGTEIEKGRQRDNRIIKIILSCVFALIFAAAVFLAGFLTARLTMSSEARSLEWILDTIEKNYYFYDDFDSEGVSFNSVASRLDIYSAYYTKEEYEALVNDNAGAKSGIGISYSFVPGKGALIVTVMGNSPANAAGICAGDYIVGGIKNGVRVDFSESNDFSSFLDGFETGEEISLISSSGKIFTLSKEMYTASYAFMATADTAWEFRSPAEGGGLSLYESKDKALDFLPEGAAYVRATQFYGTLASEFGNLMKKFNADGCTSLILDLRNNGGGYVEVMRDMAGYFVSSVKSTASVVMTAEYRGGRTENYLSYTHSGDSLVPAGTHVYVLANSGTASASEALIGVLVSYGFLEYEDIFISDFSAEYLAWAGTGAKTAQTYGKGIMQSPFRNFWTGEVLKLTTARILWPNGKCIHDVALTAADGCTLVPAAWTATAGDEELRTVVDIINNR